jgi:hypothetical protein
MRQKLTRIIIVVVLLIVALICFSAYESNRKQSEIRKTGDTFLNYTLQDNASASYALLTTTTKKSLSPISWTGIVDKLYASFLGKKPVYASSITTGNDTTLTYNISGIDGKYVFSVTVLKSDSTWQVQSFASKLQH